MVVIGSVAGLVFLIVTLILVSNRDRGKIEIYFRDGRRKEIDSFSSTMEDLYDCKHCHNHY